MLTRVKPCKFCAFGGETPVRIVKLNVCIFHYRLPCGLNKIKILLFVKKEKSIIEHEVIELAPPRPVIVAVLEMSLLGDGPFTRSPRHSSASSASRPVFKRCQ